MIQSEKSLTGYEPAPSDWLAVGPPILRPAALNQELAEFFQICPAFGSPWEVKTAELKLAEKKVEIELGWQWDQSAQCPECGRKRSIHDCAPERTWRRQDTMQFATLIRARTPRAGESLLFRVLS